MKALYDSEMENPESFPNQNFVLRVLAHRKSLCKVCSTNGHFQCCSNWQENREVSKALTERVESSEK